MNGRKNFHTNLKNQPNEPVGERVVSERGRKELPPSTRGGENLKPNRYYEHKQHAFDSYCKKVLKCEACNGYRQISRHQKRFASLEELSEADMAQLAVYDRYSWEYTAFPVGNAVVLIENDRLATALPVSYTHLDVYKRQVYAMNPSIFVLDEPTANLDADAIDTLRQQIIQIKKEGRTVVIALSLIHILLFVSSPLILLQQWVQFLTGGDILYQHGHFCKSALCYFQCGGSFGAGGGDLGHPAFQIRVAFDFMLSQEVQRPGSLFQVVELCPLLVPCELLDLDAVFQINPQRNFTGFFGLPLREPTFDAFDDGFLGIGFSQRFAAGEPLLSGCAERNVLAPLDLVALLLQEPQKIVKILGLQDDCIYGSFQLRLPACALAVCVPLGITLAPVLTGHYHG